MQLIFDCDTDADISKINMAIINSENINEKFSSDRLLDKFSQNECVEKSQEDIKKIDDDDIKSKDVIEDASSIEINKFCDSNSNDMEEKVCPVQSSENMNKDYSKAIATSHLDNPECGTTDIETTCNEIDKKSLLKLESTPKNVETEMYEKEILTKLTSQIPVAEICSNIETENTSSFYSKETCLNNDESAITSEISNYSEKMDIDGDYESNADTSNATNVLQKSCEKLTAIVESPKYDKTPCEEVINAKDGSVENKKEPHTEVATIQNKANDSLKNEDVHITDKVDSIVDNPHSKSDVSPKEANLLDSDTLPMDVSDKSITNSLPVSSKNHVDSNTVQINDDSSHDEISQKASVNKSIVLSPTNKEKLEDNETTSNNITIKDHISNSKELTNFNEKNEHVSKSNEDSKVEQDKYCIDSSVQKRLSVDESSEVKGSLKSKLSNTLNILSDDDENHGSKPKTDLEETNKPCINLEDDDDDILLIDDEDTSKREKKVPPKNLSDIPEKDVKEILENNQAHAEEKLEMLTDNTDLAAKEMKEPDEKPENTTAESHTEKLKSEAEVPTSPASKPLLPTNFLSMCKKNVSEMTRNDLEEFCIMKIVESVVDRGNIGEMKSQLKKMAVSLDEHRNKIKSITKQNQDLQVILRSVQEACKKNSLVTPLKITRSVGIQVLTAEKSKQKSTASHQNNATTTSPAKPVRSPSLQNKSKQITTPTQNIPVPRLVPAKNSPSSIMQNQTSSNKVPNIMQNTPIRPAPPRPEKRTFSKSQTGSDTVDLTDDEPPNKVVTRPGNQTVRVVSPQNLMPPQHRVNQMVNSPRKVYIPIGGGQVANIRPTSPALLVKTVNNQNVRQRVPGMRRGHPAPLPESSKQYQSPSWKAIPPAPEIKLSKVENGIVISWKLDNYREDIHENIASYQIYAYQETPSPPNTNLWKKIGDVKALPLPMACTLTQFVPGFKYYFAVRAVDVRSRQGSFSNPGNIMLLNK